MYVEFDKKTEELVLSLPEEVKEYFQELYGELIDNYGFDSINKNSLAQMNTFVEDFFSNKGIVLPKQ
jgi:hypothetical protein